MKKELVLGIDIGGTFTKIGLVDRQGKTAGTKIFSTEAHNPFNEYTYRGKIKVMISKGARDWSVVGPAALAWKSLGETIAP